MSATFPTSLLTSDSAAGHALAQRLATQLFPAASSGTDMASHLRTAAPAVSAELATAIYFHAITLANRGWNEPRPR